MSANFGSGGARLGANVTGPNTSTGVTLCGWVYLKANALSCWASLAYGVGSDTIQIIYDGAFRAQVQANGSFTNASATLPGIGQWFHWALTWDGTTCLLYANGVAGSPQTLSAGAGQAWTALTAGFSTFSSNAYAQDAFFYSRALSGAEVAAQMATRSILSSTGLVAEYPIQAGATRNNDFSGNARTLTTVGTVTDGDKDAPVDFLPTTIDGVGAASLVLTGEANGAVDVAGTGAASLEVAGAASALLLQNAQGDATLEALLAAAGLVDMLGTADATLALLAASVVAREDPRRIVRTTLVRTPTRSTKLRCFRSEIQP